MHRFGPHRNRRRRRGPISATLLVAAAIIAPPIEVLADPPNVGFTHWQLRDETVAQQNEICDSVLKPEGIEYLHTELVWARVQTHPATFDVSNGQCRETSPGRFDFSFFDDAFRRLHACDDGTTGGVKVYLTLGGPGQGDIAGMPDFVFNRNWEVVHVGRTRNVNRVDWRPTVDKDVVEFDFSGTDWLYMNWGFDTATRIVDVRPGETLDYILPIRSNSGSDQALAGYEVRDRATRNWLADAPLEPVTLVTHGGFHPRPVTVTAPAEGDLLVACVAATCNVDTNGDGTPDALRFTDADHYLAFRIGTSDTATSGAGAEFDVNLADFEVRRGGVALTHQFDFADADRLRMLYRIENGEMQTELRATFSDSTFQCEEELWLRNAVEHIENESYADIVVAYGPDNEPWVTEQPGTVADFSEANRVAFVAWQKDQYGAPPVSTEIPRLPPPAVFDTTNGFRYPPLTVNTDYKAEFAAVGSTPEAWLDFARFMREEYTFAHLNSRLAIIKSALARAGKNKPTFIKMLNRVPLPDHVIADAAPRFAASPHLDILGVDTYSAFSPSLDIEDVAAIRPTFVTLVTIAQRYGKRWGIFEFGAGIPHHADVLVADMLRYTMAYGPEAVFAYKLVDLPVDPDPERCPDFVGFDPGGPDPDCHEGYYRLIFPNTGMPPSVRGPKIPEYTMVVDAIKTLNGRRTATPAAEVALLYSTNVTAYRGNQSAIQDTIRAVADLGLRATVLYDYEVRETPLVLTRFKAIVLPRFMIARESSSDSALIDALGDFVDDGGHVIVQGIYDRYTAALDPVATDTTDLAFDWLPATIDSVFNFNESDFDFLVSFPSSAPYTWRGKSIFSGWPDQTVLSAKPDSRVVASYARSGKPAIVESNDGRVVVIGPTLGFNNGDLDRDGDVDGLDGQLITDSNCAYFGQRGYTATRDLDGALGTCPAGTPDQRLDDKDYSLWLSRYCGTLIGGQCSNGDSFNLAEFYRPYFDQWGLLPMQVSQGVVAHLGTDGLAIANRNAVPKNFVLVLPFQARKLDETHAVTFTTDSNQTLVTGRILGRQAILVRLDTSIPGDIDGSGSVDRGDFEILLGAFGSCSGDPRFVAAADLDGDGCVTFVDYQIWYGFFAP